MNAPVQQGLPNLPTEQEIALAKEGSRELSMVMTTPEETQEITVCMGHSEQRVHLPASAVQMLMDILVNISQGNAVQVDDLDQVACLCRIRQLAEQAGPE